MNNKINIRKVFSTFGIFGRKTLKRFEDSEDTFEQFYFFEHPSFGEKMISRTFTNYQGLCGYIQGIRDALDEDEYWERKLIKIEECGSNINDNGDVPTSDLWYEFMREYINVPENIDDLMREESLFSYLNDDISNEAKICIEKDFQEYGSDDERRISIIKECHRLGVELFSKALMNYYRRKFSDELLYKKL